MFAAKSPLPSRQALKDLFSQGTPTGPTGMKEGKDAVEKSLNIEWIYYFLLSGGSRIKDNIYLFFFFLLSYPSLDTPARVCVRERYLKEERSPSPVVKAGVGRVGRNIAGRIRFREVL